MGEIIEQNVYLEGKRLIGKKGLEEIERLKSFWKKEKAKPEQEREKTGLERKVKGPKRETKEEKWLE